MRTIRTLTKMALTVGLVVLTGCASTEATSTTDTGSDTAHADLQAAQTENMVATDGERSAERLNQLLATLDTVYVDQCDTPFETLAGYQECNPDDPVAYLESFESPRPGELVVTLTPEAWGGGEYNPDQVYTVPYLADNLLAYIEMQTDELHQLTVTTPDGSHQATEGQFPQSQNPDAPQTEVELQEWADARFQDWLHAMDVTYRDLCGGVDSVADYRQCVPDDPHGYITGIESPAAGELVVHVENGPWQGGTYDMPGAHFMSDNMLIKIAYSSTDVDKLTVSTEDGQCDTAEWDRRLESYYEAELTPGHL